MSTASVSSSLPEPKYHSAGPQPPNPRIVRVLATAPSIHPNTNSPVAIPNPAPNERLAQVTNRILRLSFQSLLPQRTQANKEALQLSRPDAQTVEDTKERTAAVLGLRRSNVPRMGEAELPEFVQCTSKSTVGAGEEGKIVKIQKRQVDPCEQPKFKRKRIPGRAASPPVPVLRSASLVLIAEQQEEWKITPPIWNWKNPNGYAVPLDKRLAPGGRELQDDIINVNNFSDLSDTLQSAERCAREDVSQRAILQQRLKEKEKSQNEGRL